MSDADDGTAAEEQSPKRKRKKKPPAKPKPRATRKKKETTAASLRQSLGLKEPLEEPEPDLPTAEGIIRGMMAILEDVTGTEPPIPEVLLEYPPKEVHMELPVKPGQPISFDMAWEGEMAEVLGEVFGTSGDDPEYWTSSLVYVSGSWMLVLKQPPARKKTPVDQAQVRKERKVRRLRDKLAEQGKRGSGSVRIRKMEDGTEIEEMIPSRPGAMEMGPATRAGKLETILREAGALSDGEE